MRTRQRWKQATDWFGVSPAKMSKAVRTALKAALRHRHVKYMPLHFSMAAYPRYPDVYKRRMVPRPTGGGKVYSDPLPLHESGATKDLVMGSAKFTASKVRGGTTIRARATFQVPYYLKYIKFRGYDPSAELAATNRQEKRAMQNVFAQALQGEISGDEGRLRIIRI